MESKINIGDKFNRLTVIGYEKGQSKSAGQSKRPRRYLCLCDCANQIAVIPGLLKKSLTKSCGCFKTELLFANSIKIGEKYNRCTILSYIKDEKNRGIYIYQCDCGTIGKSAGSDIKRGIVKSCGCFSRERMSFNMRTHNKSGTPTYRSWVAMIQRCTNPKKQKFERYGGRGIKVIEKWLKFENFYKDMGERPLKTSLDRIDNNQDYSPENCKWSTQKEQCQNRNNNRLFTLNNETLCFTEWTRRLNVTSPVLRNMVKNDYFK